MTELESGKVMSGEAKSGEQNARPTLSSPHAIFSPSAIKVRGGRQECRPSLFYFQIPEMTCAAPSPSLWSNGSILKLSSMVRRTL